MYNCICTYLTFIYTYPNLIFLSIYTHTHILIEEYTKEFIDIDLYIRIHRFQGELAGVEIDGEDISGSRIWVRNLCLERNEIRVKVLEEENES